MRLRRAAMLLVLAACGDGEDAAPDPLARFDLDVEVHPWGARVWLREQFATGCEPEETFPRPRPINDCGDRTLAELACAAPTGACLRRVALERDGVVLGEASLDRWWHAMTIDAPLADGPSELVIDGCGGSQRIALPAATTARPTVTDIATNGSNVLGTMTPTAGADSSVTAIAGSRGGMVCHELGVDTWRLLNTSYPGALTVASVTGRPEVETPWGLAYVWSLASTAPTPILIPKPFGELWEIEAHGTPTWTLNGVAPSPAPVGWRWRFRPTADGPRHDFDGGTIRYTAGDTTDYLSVLATPNGFFNGSFPHVVPTDDLEQTMADNGHVALTVGPVALTSGSTTRTFTLTLAWDHPLVARVAR